MTLYSIADTIAHMLSLMFASAALLHLGAPPFIKSAYQRWDFARGFHYVAGSAMALAALFLAIGQTRIWGGILAAMILFVAVVSLLNRGKYAYAAPAILVMIALAPAMVGTV